MAFALLVTALLAGLYLAGAFALKRRFELSALAFATTVLAPIAAFILVRVFGVNVEAYIIAFAAFLGVAGYWFTRAPSK